MAYTYTRTYNTIEFANPYIICVECERQVEGVLCRYKDAWPNLPCLHEAGFIDTCPSWSPVEGCQCKGHLGYRPHEVT